MRAKGLRFSSLGTNRYHTAYKLYWQQGYVETNVWATAMAKWETAHQPTRLRAQAAGPSEIESLRRAGYRVAHPAWDAFMVKPLIPEITANDAVRIFGIGTDRFLISWLDTT